MAFFKKNANEVAFVGGKKHWIDVIKNTGPSEALIYRQPEEDFNTNSTLIVMPGEQAIFVKGGVIEKTFEKGTYQLSTENYPFISRLRTAFSGGISTFNCVVYYVRTAAFPEILWGTTSPIFVRDKVFNIQTSARARGAYRIKVKNPELLLEKLNGNNVNCQSASDITRFFENEFQMLMKSTVSRFLNSIVNELVGIDAYLYEISQCIEPVVDEALKPYGLGCEKFSLSGLDIDISKYETIDAAQLDVIIQTKRGQGEKARLQILGDDWGKVEGVEILKDLANNPNSGGAAATGAGIGMGIGAIGVYNSIAQSVFGQTPWNGNNGGYSPQQGFGPQNGFERQASQWQQANVPPAQPQNFTGFNNYQTNQQSNYLGGNSSQPNVTAQGSGAGAADDPVTKIKQLKMMLDIGAISMEEYNMKKNEILSRM